MKTQSTSILRSAILSCLLIVFAGFFIGLNAQSFSLNSLNFNNKGSVSAGTGIKFGPDGRLYVTEYSGKIKIFTIERNGPGNYVVLNTEVLSHIQQIQNYNDDGTLYSSANRETIGITVVGTASNPVIYVTSSDFRIGGGGGGGSGDVNLDTNSGIITRFKWTGSAWDVVDIVRGLPRSEENHATNGLEFVTIKGIDYLIVAQGGHTNAGAPSQNFAYTAEYALSAAVLSVNLSMLEAMPVLVDNGRKYIYDLPTLDDPTRPNKNGITNPDAIGYDGIDVNDPFGGNDGLNQAIIVPGGPVQIFSPGYRNAYDLVVTQKGAVYVTDNGANGGWGGFPVNEGGGNANNDYDPTEPGSSTSSGNEKINNKDHLTLITTDIQNYNFGSFYGGHPTPIRANPSGAGLYTNPAVTGTVGALFRTKIYHPSKNTTIYTSDPKLGLPANWPPVKTANLVEGDYRGPGDPNPDGPVDALVTTWGTNTNGIDEYKASNFNGAMKGDLIAGVNTGELRRVELKEDGSLENLTASFASGIGGNALGIACNGDNEIFPGTIWVVTLNGKLVVLEPQDFSICIKPGDAGYDPLADYDLDGYTNKDEMDNGSDPCNGGSQPTDHDKVAGGVLSSDLNDPDDDNDGIPDAEDPFQLGDPLKEGSDAFDLPVINELFSSNNLLQGYMGLGMTGMMNNGSPNPNWLNWLDQRDNPNDPNPNDILGGAIGAMTMHMTAGTAFGTNNNQTKAFQYGVKVSSASGIITVAGGLFNFNAPLQLYGHSQAPNGELGIFIGDGFQSNYIKFVLTQKGLVVQQEINDIPQIPLKIDISVANRPQLGAALYFVINTSTGQITFEYAFDSGVRKTLGTLMAQGNVLQAIQQQSKDLVVGLIGTSNAPGVEVEGTWDYLNVSTGAPYVIQKLPDIERQIGAGSVSINLNEYFSDENGVENLVYTLVGNTNNAVGAGINSNILSLNFSNTPAVSQITVRATNKYTKYVEQTFSVVLYDAPMVLYRVNAGGPLIASIDGEIDWGADTATQISPYLSEPGRNKTYIGFMNSYTTEVDLATTPVSIYHTERYDSNAGAPNMTYSFPVQSPGKYEVRLYMGNSHVNTSLPGSRIFNVEIEKVLYSNLENLDLAVTFGQKVGAVISHTIDVTDGVIDITFIHVVENPLVNGLEILSATRDDNPIQVAQLPDQFNLLGDQLDGSLVATAKGGDGNLKYSITGQPPGITIEPTNGQIGGTIGSNANLQNPYMVTVVVDDSDEKSNDAVSINFKWTITSGEPLITNVLPDINKFVGAAPETIDLNNYFKDINANNTLNYSVTQNTNTAISTKITNSLLTISFPQSPAISTLTIRATNVNSKFVEQSFKVTVTNSGTQSLVLFRVNSGGPAIKAIDGGIDWGVDTETEISPYLSEPGRNKTYSGIMKSYTGDVNLTTTPSSIFNSERYDSRAGVPNMTYSFPVTEPGMYEVRLYMGNGHINTSLPGTRIFDVSIEGIIYSNLDNLDLSATFGHQIGAVITHTVEVLDGVLNISFLHVVENPLVNGIEILGSSKEVNPIQVVQLPNQSNFEGDVLNGTLKVSATGGDGALVYTIQGAPSGVQINASTGVINGTIGINTASGSPYNVTVTVDDSDGLIDDKVNTYFTWTITTKETLANWYDKNENENYTARHECSFVQAGDKFYLFGGREKARTIDIYDYKSNSWVSLVDSAPFEFNHFQAVEYQGLIWVIGAFKDNVYPRETPAEFIYIFDPVAKQWFQGPEIPVGRRRGSTGLVMHNNVFYIIGGNTNGHDGGYVSWFDKYDPKTGIWTSLTNAPRARDHFQAAVIGNKLYAAGGRLSGGTGGVFKPVIAEIDVYDFTTLTWSTLPTTSNIPTPRAAASVVNYNGKLLVIGGEVENEPVYGVITTDALKITEEYDPSTNKWKRASDLNFKRHGTQAIVSGEGVFTLAGSPNKGGGSQKNMEYLGQDVPAGTTSTTSLVSVPGSITVTNGVSSNIELKILNGNVGTFVKSITISGVDAASFIITSGNLINSLINVNSTHNIMVGLVGTPTQSKTATLNIYYGSSGIATVTLKHDVQNSMQLQPIANQANYEGDILDGSLKASATGGDGALVYKISGAPGSVVINSTTGVISGTIGSNTASGSPYAVTVTVDDSDGQTDDAVSTQFNWTISTKSTQIPIVVTGITNQSNYSGDVLNGSLAVNATGGDGALKYSISNAPKGVIINSANGIISGTIAQDAHLLSPYNVSVTVDDSDTFTNDAVTVNFTWKVGEVPVTYQGCTAAFWSNSTGWCSTYKPTDNFFTVFGITNKRGLGGKTGTLTLLEALKLKGSGYNKLAIQATAALLNACSPNVNYQFTETQVKSEVKDAFNNSAYNNSYANTLSSKYETANSAGCPPGASSAIVLKTNESLEKDLEESGYDMELNLEESKRIQLFPNPANAEVYLQTPNSTVRITAVSIYDYNSRYIGTFTTGKELTFDGNVRYSFNIFGMPNGVYILKVGTESSEVLTFRLIKED